MKTEGDVLRYRKLNRANCGGQGDKGVGRVNQK